MVSSPRRMEPHDEEDDDCHRAEVHVRRIESLNGQIGDVHAEIAQEYSSGDLNVIRDAIEARSQNARGRVQRPAGCSKLRRHRHRLIRKRPDDDATHSD